MITEERIREIIKMSGFDTRGDEVFVGCRCDDIEISDELMLLVRHVVIECADAIEDMREWRVHDSEFADYLREHFGVK